LREIQKLLDLKQNADYKKCVEISKDLFNYYYDHNIRDLLSIFPKDHKDSHGMPFWSGPKRAPDFITFDANDELTLMFIMACANLIAYNLGIEQEKNSEVVRKIAS
jgi:ubiquitin-activating enzyme E1